CELNTMLLGGAVGPDGPVARALLLDVLVDDAAHEQLVQRTLEGHAMHVANLESSHVAAHLSGELVLGGGPRLEWIVVSDESGVALASSAMEFPPAVFHADHVVVRLVGGNLSADFREPRRAFHVAIGPQLGRRGWGRPAARGEDRHAGDRQESLKC